MSDKKPTLADLGLDAPAPPPNTKKTWQQIADETDSVALKNTIPCRKCGQLIHRESTQCAFCKATAQHPLATDPTEHKAPANKTCPFCRSTVDGAAVKCPKCQEWLIKREGLISKIVKFSLVGFLLMVISCTGLLVLNRSSSSSGGSSYSSTGSRRIVNGEWPGCTTKELMDKVISYSINKDEAAFAKLMTAGQIAGTCTVFLEGEKVFLVKGEVLTGLAKIRREGETTEYWIAQEAIK